MVSKMRPSVIVAALIVGGSAILLASVPPSFAEKLPVKDGEYARVDVACDMAPMAMMDVIIKGEPIYSPQFGECKNRIDKKSAHVFEVTPTCTKENPPVIKYTIIKPTEYELWTEYGQARMRWCKTR
jgi:hypothetical protein